MELWVDVNDSMTGKAMTEIPFIGLLKQRGDPYLTGKILGCWSVELWVAMAGSMTRKAMTEIPFIGLLKQRGDPSGCEFKCTSSNWWVGLQNCK
jgi:hypothetical protein